MAKRDFQSFFCKKVRANKLNTKMRELLARCFLLEWPNGRLCASEASIALKGL